MGRLTQYRRAADAKRRGRRRQEKLYMQLVSFPLKEKNERSQGEYRIVHLSDLHYTGANLDMLAELMRHIVDIGPQFVIVTGDIVDGPMDDFAVPAAMLRGALKDVEEFHGFTPVLRVVPGNHDLFYKGTYGLRRTRKFYRAFTAEERGNYDSPDTPVMIAAFDSNQLYEPRGGFWRKSVQLARFMSHGLIIERDLDDFSEWIETIRQSRHQDACRASLKIAALHHHPMPAAYGFLPRLADESFMMLENAGAFLERLTRERFDLILHGHRHCSQFCRAAYFDPDGSESQIAVLGCGSSAGRSDEWTRSVGRNFNVITMSADGSVRATQYFRKGRRDFLPAVRDIQIRGPLVADAHDKPTRKRPTGTNGR
jgi:predicted MPP superfamily phosphohydrolase